MKMLVEIAENKATSFKELVKQYFDVKAKPISPSDASIFEDIMHIKKAFKLADKVKAGKLKTRPASELLNEL